MMWLVGWICGGRERRKSRKDGVNASGALPPRTVRRLCARHEVRPASLRLSCVGRHSLPRAQKFGSNGAASDLGKIVVGSNRFEDEA